MMRTGLHLYLAIGLSLIESAAVAGPARFEAFTYQGRAREPVTVGAAGVAMGRPPDAEIAGLSTCGRRPRHRRQRSAGDVSGAPAFVGRRQEHQAATISTTLRYTPDADGDRAGLAAVQNDRSFLVFAVTRIAGKPMIALYTRDAATADTLVAAEPIATSTAIVLTLRIDGGTMAFDYTVAGRRRTLKTGLDATFLGTRRAGGFVGTVIGPYAWKRR